MKFCAEKISSRKKWMFAALFLGLATYYVVEYMLCPLVPSATGPGWNSWWDQSHYLESARALSQGDFAPEHHWYPIGYALLATPFVFVSAEHPFFVPNLLMFLACAYLLFRIARQFLSDGLAVLAGLACLFVLRDEIVIGFVIPWNTIPVTLLLYTIVALLFKRKVFSTKYAFVVAALCGLIYLFRPLDILLGVPMLCGVILFAGEKRLNVIAAVTAGLSIGPVILHALNGFIYGSFFSPYQSLLLEIGLWSHNPLYRLYGIFLDGWPIDETDTPMLMGRMSWLPVSFFATPWLWEKQKAKGICVVAAIASCYALYLGYNDLLPAYLYGRLLVHYLVWTFPLLLIFACVFLVNVAKTARKKKVFYLLLGLAVVYASLFSIKLTHKKVAPLVLLEDGHLMEESGYSGLAYDMIELRLGEGSEGLPLWQREQFGEIWIEDRLPRPFRDVVRIGPRFWFSKPHELSSVRVLGAREKTNRGVAIALGWAFEPSLNRIFKGAGR